MNIAILAVMQSVAATSQVNRQRAQTRSVGTTATQPSEAKPVVVERREGESVRSYLKRSFRG